MEVGGIADPVLRVHLVVQGFATGAEVVHAELAGPLFPHGFGFGGILLFATEERDREERRKGKRRGERGGKEWGLELGDGTIAFGKANEVTFIWDFRSLKAERKR